MLMKLTKYACKYYIVYTYFSFDYDVIYNGEGRVHIIHVPLECPALQFFSDLNFIIHAAVTSLAKY